MLLITKLDSYAPLIPFAHAGESLFFNLNMKPTKKGIMGICPHKKIRYCPVP